MKIVIDRDLCEANARCVRAAPEVFRVDDADKLVLLHERPGPGLLEKVQRAVRACPRAALRLEAE